jgi:predicted glycoside hydrolase/deacetylase ChbG (UPF0249 family)
MVSKGQRSEPASSAPGVRPIVLCADDYGLAPGLSHAIIELLSRRRLSATSCMTLSPYWPELAPLLDGVCAKVDVGLHLTLTDHQPLGPLPCLAPDGRMPPLGRLLRRAFARRLDRAEIAAELRRQLDAFVAARGRPPDFVDGHQHVHLLPGVREEVMALLSGPLAGRAYLRSCWEPPAQILARRVGVAKAMFIAGLSLPLRRAALRKRIPVNDGFRGVVDYARPGDYAAIFPRFLRGAGERPIIMCHPGRVDPALEAADPLTDARQREYDYFASAVFPADLAAAHCRLARFGAMDADGGHVTFS